ncbi:hypothetical protein NON20_25080 (plasmid) [Synechocystis sp. B12]|nr:hypothetical protein NON20_25080 [Synechocystis sp. B12]
MNDSLETYSPQHHSLPMISFLLLENINKALIYNQGLPQAIREFLKEAIKELKKKTMNLNTLRSIQRLLKIQKKMKKESL